MDLNKELAAQAVGQLAFDIDNEVISTLDGAAGAVDSKLVFSKTLPVGVNYKLVA